MNQATGFCFHNFAMIPTCTYLCSRYLVSTSN